MESGEAFSSVYDEYDTLSKENFVDIMRRKFIRECVEKYLPQNASMLEINAGGGIDAAYFSKKGISVLATDISAGSEMHIRNRIRREDLSNVRFRKCSFNQLGSINEQFDCIFSNFGGLNCTNDLSKVFSSFDALLKNGGHCTLVIMPPYYPWEMASLLTGNRNALRRMKKLTTAKIVDHIIGTFYHTPSNVRAAIGENFTMTESRNIGTFYPSSHFSVSKKFGRIMKWLVRLDQFISNCGIFPTGIGDYYLITFQKKIPT